MSQRAELGGARGGANVVVGVLLVALGVLFFVGQFIGVNLASALWPLFIIIPGVAFFVAMVLGGRPLAPLAIPGSVVTMVGLLLLYQNTFGHWESWSYAWALIPTAVGIGLFIQGTLAGQPHLRESGSRVAKVGIVLFVAFGVFFELVLNIGGYWGVGRWLWPVLLIVIGVYLLLGWLPRSSRRI